MGDWRAEEKTAIALKQRIQNYLGNGGLFNPEHMEHDKVRLLVLDFRDFLNAPSISSPAKEGGM